MNSLYKIKNNNTSAGMFRVLLCGICLFYSKVSAAGIDRSKIDIASSDYIVKYIFFLVIVLSLCFLFLLLIKKLRSSSYSGRSLIRHISTFHLSPKEKLLIMAVQDEYFLLSSTGGGPLQLLHKFERPPVSDEEPSVSNTESLKFLDSLKRYMSLSKEDA